MIFNVFWTVGLFMVVFLMWRVVWILTVAVDNQIQQTSNILLEVERVRVQMFLLRKREPEPERGWEAFDKEVRSIVNSYIVPERFTIRR